MRSSIGALLDGRYFHETCREEPFKSFLEDCLSTMRMSRSIDVYRVYNRARSGGRRRATGLS